MPLCGLSCNDRAITAVLVGRAELGLSGEHSGQWSVLPMSPPSPPAKYQPLLHLLRRLPTERRHLQLTLPELTDLVGPLARSTLLDGYWRYSGTAQRNWLAAGFAARWDSAAQIVTFTRTEP